MNRIDSELIPVCMVAAGLLHTDRAAVTRRRLEALQRPAPPSAASEAGRTRRGLHALDRPASRRRLWVLGVGATAALAAAVTLAGPDISGVVVVLTVGVAAAMLAARTVRRYSAVPPTDLRAVAMAADLMAACLDAGCSEVEALQGVAAALGGPIGHRFAQVAGALRMGLPAEDAWRPLADDPATAPLALAACRVVRTGAPLAAAVGLVADDVRAIRRSKARESVRKAGVTAMGPLGGCFLPAFLILAIVPVVAGLIDHTLH